MTTDAATEGVAVIGMSGRFPEAQSVEELWANLCAGVEGVRVLSEEELLAAGVPEDVLCRPDYVRAAATPAGVDLFDARLFGFSPFEAEILDPQQRIFLECTREALEAVGYLGEHGERMVGVFGSASLSGYLMHQLRFHPFIEKAQYGMNMATLQLLFGNDEDYLTTRVSYQLDLRGPSMNVQTACSSSLSAVHLACQSLLDRECDLALAGGVTIRVPNRVGYFYEEGSIASPDGHCRAFDARARGTVFGSGAGVVVLKRLEDALEDGDVIRAVILGSAMNNDGSLKAGYSAPSVEAQAAVISEALQMAEVSPDSIGYVEAHGTGTELGDPIEIEALTRAFRNGTTRSGFCGIGSVKSSVGHLEAAAGVTSLIKAVLAVEQGRIPASLHFERPNPQVELAQTPFFVVDELRDWPTGTGPRRAGVSSLGAGGTNVHVIVAEPPARPESGSSRLWQLLPLSAATATALDRTSVDLAEHLGACQEQRIADIAFTLQVGRAELEHRRIVICRSADEAARLLRDGDPRQVLSRQRAVEPPWVVFMFSGQGAQHPGMARDLYEEEPRFRECVDRCCAILEPVLGLDLREMIFPEASGLQAATTSLDETRLTQPALFVIELALARLWMSWGVVPRAMIGHSIGEYVAACLAGVMSLEDALLVVAERARLMQSMPTGSMISVPLAEEDLRKRLPPELEIAALNEVDRCVVTGATDSVASLEEELAAAGSSCRRLHTSHAFHSASMEGAVEPLARRIAEVSLAPPTIPFISNVTGTWIRPDQATDPAYWASQLRRPVLFAAGIGELLSERSCLLLEVGPGRSLATLAQRHPARVAEQQVLTSLPHPQDPTSSRQAVLTALGRLWLAGARISWPELLAGERRRRVSLPTYPYERRRYWYTPAADDVAEARRAAPAAQPVADQGPFEIPVALESDPGESTRPDLPNEYVAPRGDVERQIAAIWQQLLGVEPIGVHDNFFELGGDSVLGVQIAARCNAAGIRISPRQMFEFQTVSELAAAAESTGVAAHEQGPVVGEVSLSPAQGWFFERVAGGPEPWSMAMTMEATERLDRDVVEQVIRELLEHHDALRMRFGRDGEKWRPVFAEPSEELPFDEVDLAGADGDPEQVFDEVAARAQARVDLVRGPIAWFTLVHGPEPTRSRVVVGVHHAVVDGPAKRILVEDFETAYRNLAAGQSLQLPPKSSSVRQWLELLAAEASSEATLAERSYWLDTARRKVARIPRDTGRPEAEGQAGTIEKALSEEETTELLQVVLPGARVDINEVLLGALATALSGWLDGPAALVDVARGREAAWVPVDLTRTLGWFTTIFPLRLELAQEASHSAFDLLRRAKEALRTTPREGIGYGITRFLGDEAQVARTLREMPQAEIFFVFFGLADDVVSAEGFLRVPGANNVGARSWIGALDYPLEVRSFISGGSLRVLWAFEEDAVSAEQVEQISERMVEALRSMLEHHAAGATAVSPSDFPDADLDQSVLDGILSQLGDTIT